MEKELDCENCIYREDTYDDDGNKITYCDTTDDDCVYRKKIRDKYGDGNIFICTYEK